MKRLRIVGIAIFLCGLVIGCGGETREGLVSEIIQKIKGAGSQVAVITTRVNEANEKYAKSGKLDLSDAIKAADELHKTGSEIVKTKQRIDQVKDKINDDEKREYAANQQSALNGALKDLWDQQKDLYKALATAQANDATKTDVLKKKIVEALSPFEAQAKGTTGS